MDLPQWSPCIPITPSAVVGKHQVLHKCLLLGFALCFGTTKRFITCVWFVGRLVLFFPLLVTGDIYLDPEESIWVLSQKATKRRRIA